jgi:hypothetical protein
MTTWAMRSAIGRDVRGYRRTFDFEGRTVAITCRIPTPDVGGISLFDPDLEADGGLTRDQVRRLRARIRAALQSIQLEAYGYTKPNELATNFRSALPVVRVLGNR